MNKKILLSLLTLATLNACVDLNDPYYGSGGGYYDDSYDRRRSWERERRHDAYEQGRRDAEREEERREREEQRRREESIRNERCPSGYTPSERKCSTEERRRGCKDMRLKNGLGCVRR